MKVNYWKYLKYVLKHKYFVFIEACKLGIPFRGFMHDFSKLSPLEFIGYARHFYGEKIKETDDSYDMFNLAWLVHQNRNNHHWQYWILHRDDGGTTTLDIPLNIIKEMVADWIGCGRALGKKSPKNNKFLEVNIWYEANKDKIRLSKNTRKIIENMINYKAQ